MTIDRLVVQNRCVNLSSVMYQTCPIGPMPSTPNAVTAASRRMSHGFGFLPSFSAHPCSRYWVVTSAAPPRMPLVIICVVNGCDSSFSEYWAPMSFMNDEKPRCVRLAPERAF